MRVCHIALGIVAIAAMAGCASSTSNSVSLEQGGAYGPAARPPAVPGGGQGSSAGAATTKGTTASGIVVGVPPSADIERSVTAAYKVPAGSFLESFDGVITRAVGMGGYVVNSATQPDGGGRIVSGSVTLKVPAAKIADLLNGMPGSFTASSIDFATIDHTAEFVDVNARLGSAHAHLAALDALLARATSLGDITSLEQQIEGVQAEIDTDQGQLNVLTASISLATATVKLSERGAAAAVVTPPAPVSDGLASGWGNAVRVTAAVLEGVVSALPLLALALLGWLAWRRLGRPGSARRRPGAGE
jgi:hypothetical protein